MKAKNVKEKNIYDYAARKLTAGRRTCAELVNWLVSQGFEREESENVTEEFRNLGYLDDENYAADYFRYGAGKGWSNKRIQRQLALKGVSGEDISAGLERYISGKAPSVSEERKTDSEERKTDSEERKTDAEEQITDAEEQKIDAEERMASDEYERALSVARKMTSASDLENGRLPEKIKARVARRLAGYGYGTSVIYDTVRKIENELSERQDD